MVRFGGGGTLGLLLGLLEDAERGGDAFMLFPGGHTEWEEEEDVVEGRGGQLWSM